MKAIECKTVVDTIAAAMEKAYDADQVLIIARCPRGDEGVEIKYFCNDAMTLGDINWLLDQYKYWLFQEND